MAVMLTGAAGVVMSSTIGPGPHKRRVLLLVFGLGAVSVGLLGAGVVIVIDDLNLTTVCYVVLVADGHTTVLETTQPPCENVYLDEVPT